MENIKLNFAVLCDYAFFSDSSKPNIIGIFQNIVAPNFPYKHPQMFIVTNVSFQAEGKYKEVVRLISKKTGVDILPPLEFDLDVKKISGKDTTEVGIVGQINEISFPEQGEYCFRIEMNNELLSEIPLSVMQQK